MNYSIVSLLMISKKITFAVKWTSFHCFASIELQLVSRKLKHPLMNSWGIIMLTIEYILI
jgi:hypothetical protein